MSDEKEKKDDSNPLKDLQDQLQKMFKGSNLSVGMPNFNFGNDVEVDEPGEPPVEEERDNQEVLKNIRNFHLKPREIRDYLDRFVIKQNEAKKVLSVAICDHYNHVRQSLQDENLAKKPYSKQNILLLGPTGVGKTFLMRNIAKMIGVPFVKADATKFSETGYVGGDVDDLVRDLVKAANGDVELAQYGIIYIDEIDKIASQGGQGKDVSGRGVQLNLLKLMEDTDVPQFSPTDMMAQMRSMMDMGRSKKGGKGTISTGNILFIVSGAFDKLAEAVQRRLRTSQIGFTADGNLSDDEQEVHRYLMQAATRDFIDYGYEPEFIGRLPVRVACEPLQAQDLEDILLTSESSILRQYVSDFAGYGIDFSISKEAIKEVALRASTERTGARGLMTVMEQILRNYKFELPSAGVEKLHIDREDVEDTHASLAKILAESRPEQRKIHLADLNRYAKGFEHDYEIKLEFTSDAEDELIRRADEKNVTMVSLCELLFKDFQHGLKIIERNIDKSTFTIDADTVKNPDGVLSRWVVESFEEQKKNNETPIAEPSE